MQQASYAFSDPFPRRLPPAKNPVRRLAILFGVIVGLLVALGAGLYIYTKVTPQHRILVENGYDQAVDVTIDGDRFSIGPRSSTSVAVGDGAITVKAAGPIEETHSIEMPSTGWRSAGRVALYNIGGKSHLAVVTITYGTTFDAPPTMLVGHDKQLVLLPPGVTGDVDAAFPSQVESHSVGAVIQHVCRIDGERFTCPGAEGRAASNAVTGGASPSRALGRKLGAYIECANQFTRDVHQGRHTWLDQFDAKKGPDPKHARETLYGPLALPDPKDCKAGVDAVKAQAPKLPELEAAGDAYVAALVELQPITVKLRAYFEQGDYKDDKLAAAIEAHPKLMAVYVAFDKANRALNAEVDKLEDKLAVDSLAALEKTEGKRLRWHHKRAMLEAKKVVTIAVSVKSPFELKDTAPLAAALAAFDTAIEELAAYYEKNKAELERYTSIERELKDFLKDAKDMLRRVRDKQHFSSGEKMTINANNAEAVEGTPARVIRSYNTLIDSSNRSQF
jgi:hypothetical protein